jgi:hypothetical protein
MAKPINLYQGPAPAAMGMMGQGILEAGANIGRTIQSGYESMGKGLGQGIQSAGSAIASAYTQSKDDQAKFDAMKKMVKAFEGYLPKQEDPVTGKKFSPIADELKGFLNDTTISTREKIAMTPMVMSFLGNAQQQYGRENVANIMAGNRLDVAALKNPPPAPRPPFDATQKINPYDQPAGQTPSSPQPNYSDLPKNSSQGNPGALTQSSKQGTPMISIDGTKVYNPKTGKWVTLDINLLTGEAVPDDFNNNSSELVFDPRTKRIKK